jgi:hypothetical protein
VCAGYGYRFLATVDHQFDRTEIVFVDGFDGLQIDYRAAVHALENLWIELRFEFGDSDTNERFELTCHHTRVLVFSFEEQNIFDGDVVNGIADN